MTQPNVAEVTTELSALKAFFNKARESLAKGSVDSMQGIDKRIAAACAVVQAVSVENQQQLLPELTGLIDLLNVYERELRDFQAVQLAAAAKVVSQDAKS